MALDTNKIINGTPLKVFLNGYDKMKADYNQDTANEFKACYADMPVEFILDNSRKIFSEPYCGLDFYKKIVLNPNSCIFTRLGDEYEKVASYLEDNEGTMPQSQKDLYHSFKDDFKKVLDDTYQTRVMADYVKSNEDANFEKNLCEKLAHCDDNIKNTLDDIFKNSSNVVFFTYSPYAYKKANIICDPKVCIDKMKNIVSVDKDCGKEGLKDYFKTQLCSNKLCMDEAYKEAVNSIDNMEVRNVFTVLGTVDVKESVEEMTTKVVNVSEAVFTDPVFAMNNLFDDIYEESVLGKKENENIVENALNEAYFDIIHSEYMVSESSDTEIAKGYGIEGETIDATYQKILESVSTDPDVFFEEDEEVSSEEVADGKKPVAPMFKNKHVKKQTKYMDKEVKQMKKDALKKQRGEEKVGAMKAALAIPKNKLEEIKAEVKKLDDMDEQRRKNYMTEPGFRKKAFKNLKLAILYGGTAAANVAMLPVVMVARHYSKEKDRRIRNELVRELTTEVKITEEKINDANAKGDNTEKYRLMQIRDRLETEIARVRLNSQHI